jgi:membrane fusion protein, multidrug efflux system
VISQRLFLSAVIVALVAGCGPSQDAKAPDPPLPARPVRTVTVGAPAKTAPDVFPGRIEGSDVVDLGFRIGGRVSERLVTVGSQIKPGQVIARLENEVELNDLRSAQAALAAAESAERQAAAQLGRTTQLHARGIASQAEFEAAQQAAKGAHSQRDVALARLRIAEDVVGFTVLKADADGVVTSVGAEPGEVVAAGRPVVRVTRRDGRDAVIDVPAAALDSLSSDSMATVRLSGDTSTSAKGRIREVSPEADPVTRLFRVRVGLTAPPAAMRLGASVQVSILAPETAGISVPTSALIREGNTTAVLVLDSVKGTVNRRAVEVVSGDPGTVIVASGLAPGDVVVTAGTSTLKDGQKVRVAGGPQ